MMLRILAPVIVVLFFCPLFANALTCPTLSRTLQMGSSGSDVIQLQKFLIDNGFLVTTSVGYFGPLTQKSLQAWQASRGIVSSGTPLTTGWGVAGPRTRSSIASCAGTVNAQTPEPSPVPAYTQSTRTLSLGMQGSDVAALQYFLIGQGYLATGNATGYFGPLTQAAVQAFQRARGIVTYGLPSTTGYGAVGPRTRAAMGGGGSILASQCPYFALPKPRDVCSTSWTSLTNAQNCQIGWQCGPPQIQTPLSPYPIATPLASCALDGISLQSGQSALFYANRSVQSPATCASQSESRTCTNGRLSGSYSYGSCSQTQILSIPRSCTLNGLTLESGQSATFFSASSAVTPNTCIALSQSRMCVDGTLSGSFGYSQCSQMTSGTQQASCSFNSQSVAHGGNVTAYQTNSAPYGQTCASEYRTCSNGTLSGTYTHASCSTQTAASCVLDGATLSHGSSQTFYSSRTVAYGTQCTTVAQARTCSNGALSGGSAYQYASCATSAAVSCTLDGVTIHNGSSATFYSTQTQPYGSSCSSVVQVRNCTNGNLDGSSTYRYSQCVETQPSSCTLDGQSVAHGQSRMFYTSQSVAAGAQCASVGQNRTCSNGSLDGTSTYQYANCTPQAAAFSMSLSAVNSAGASVAASAVVNAGVDNSPFPSVTIPNNTATTLQWSTSGTQAGSCTLYKWAGALTSARDGGGVGVSGSESASAFDTGLITQSTVFTLSCVDASSLVRKQTSILVTNPVTTASCAFNSQSVAHGANVTAYQTASVPAGQTCASQTRSCSNGTLSGTYAYASCTVASTVPIVADVQNYGARADGVSDDTAAVQAALNSGAPAVYIPNGTYRVGALAVPDSVRRIYGNGHGNSRFVQAAAGSNILNLNGVSDVTIENLGFIGLAAGGSASVNTGVDIMSSNNITVRNSMFTGLRMTGVYTRMSNNVLVENNDIHDTYSGILCNGGSGITFRGNHIYSPLYRNEFTVAISLGSTDQNSYGICQNADISNNEFEDYDFAQNILIHAGIHVTVIGNTMKNALIGISLNPHGPTDRVDDVVIRNNSYIGSTRTVNEEGNAGIAVGGDPGNPVSNVTIDNNAITLANAMGKYIKQGGITLGHTANLNVLNNNISDSYGSGIVVVNEAVATSLNIHNNRILRIYPGTDGGFGIYIYGRASGRIQDNNIFNIYGVGTLIQVDPSYDFLISGNYSGN